MILLRKGLFILLAATLMVSCGDDDESVVVTPPDNGGGTVEESPLAGTWYIASEEASIAVMTADGSTVHWSLPAADVAKRGCLLDDKFIFGADGSFKNDVGDYTWIESWQGVGSEGCGVPISPSGTAEGTFEYDGDQITISGVGAYLGLPKVYNTGTHQDVASISDASSVSYDVAEFDETAGTLTITVGYDDAGNVFQFKFVKDEPTAYAGGVTTCPADNGLAMSGFGGAAFDCGVYTFPAEGTAGVEDWAGWAYGGTDIYPLDFSANGGTITFTAETETEVTLKFVFQDAGHPNTTVSFEVTQVVAVGTNDYSVDVTAAAAGSTEYNNFLMYIVDRGIGVGVVDLNVSAN